MFRICINIVSLGTLVGYNAASAEDEHTDVRKDPMRLEFNSPAVDEEARYAAYGSREHQWNSKFRSPLAVASCSLEMYVDSVVHGCSKDRCK